MLRSQQSVEQTRIVAFAGDGREFIEDIERDAAGEIGRGKDAQGTKIASDAFADVGEIFEARDAGCGMDFHGGQEFDQFMPLLCRHWR